MTSLDCVALSSARFLVGGETGCFACARPPSDIHYTYIGRGISIYSAYRVLLVLPLDVSLARAIPSSDLHPGPEYASVQVVYHASKLYPISFSGKLGILVKQG
jgi:hypothetical protein